MGAPSVSDMFCRYIDSHVTVFFLLASSKFSCFLFCYWCFVERFFLVASVITTSLSLNKHFNKR